MVVDPIYDILETKWFQAILAVVVISAGVTGFMSPADWALTNAPIVGQLTSFLPDVVHQVVGGLLVVAGVSDLWNRFA